MNPRTFLPAVIVLGLSTSTVALSQAITIEHMPAAQIQALAEGLRARTAGHPGVASQSLAQYGMPAATLITRTRTADPEVDSFDDLLYVLKGHSTLETTTDSKTIEIAAGDVVHIPAHLPHRFVLGPSDSLNYFLIQAQVAKAPVRVAHPVSGDSPDDAGPLAQGLSPDLKPAEIAKALKLVADWQLAHLPEHPEYDWTFAALYAGMMAVPSEAGGDADRNAMQKIGAGLQWQPGPRVEHADDQAVGQMYLEQYMLHHDPAMLGPIKERIDTEVATPDDPAKILWWWCDALFMAPPVVADLASITGDQKYWSFLNREWNITQTLLYDRDEHLFSRDASYLDKREKNGRKIFWSRGNGWVMGGIVRVLDRMPASSPDRARYVKLLQEMAQATAKIQGSDGLWRAGLLDADSYPLPEISGSAFIAYAMTYGIRHHILPADEYLPVVRKAWAGMLTHVYANGRLGSIQPVGAGPAGYKPTSSYVYGVGSYLLAGTELYNLSQEAAKP